MSPWYQFDRRLCRAQSRSGRYGEEKILSRVCGDYIRRYWIDNRIYCITIQLHTYNRVSYNYN
jgi:hypothetical protein